MIVSQVPITPPPTHPPCRSLHRSPHHSPYHILPRVTISPLTHPSPIPLSNSHTQAFHQTCMLPSIRQSQGSHSYIFSRPVDASIFLGISSVSEVYPHLLVILCLPGISSVSQILSVSEVYPHSPTYLLSCACQVSHQSASHLCISSVSQVAASAAQVFASPCVLQLVFVAALRLE